MYASNFTQYNFLFLSHFCYLQNIFYTKTFPTQTFEKCIMSSIFLNFKNVSQMMFTCLKQWKMSLWNVKYTWKSMNKICSKSTIKAQEQHRRCSAVVIVNFTGVGIEDPVKHLLWSFFCYSRDKRWYFQLDSKCTSETLSRFYFD